MSLDLDEIERLAKAAVENPGFVEHQGWTGERRLDTENVAAYIAAANPAVVLELIAELRRAHITIADCVNLLQMNGIHGAVQELMKRDEVRRAVEFKP